MMYSMTGYGLSKQDFSRGSLTVEVKSINSKYFDFNLKSMDEIQSREHEIKSVIQNILTRGKISVTIHIDSDNVQGDIPEIDSENFLKHYNLLLELSSKISEKPANLFELALNQIRYSDNGGKDIDYNIDDNWLDVKKGIEQAANYCRESREQEGLKLREELLEYGNKIDSCLTIVQSIAPERTVRIKERLLKQLNDLKNDLKVDENRFEQELIFYIEKLDITEEIVRLKSHLDYLAETINDNETLKGKKLGFIGQEIGREINTIGSKANDAEIQRIVTQMKEELEKIKEQTLNVL